MPYAADTIRMPNFTAAMQAGDRMKEARRRGNLMTARIAMERRKMEREARHDDETRRMVGGLLGDGAAATRPQTGVGDGYGYGSATEAPPTGVGDGYGLGSGPDTGMPAGAPRAPQAQMRQPGLLQITGRSGWNEFALKRPDIARKLFDLQKDTRGAQQKDMRRKAELSGRLAQAVLNAPEGMARQDMYSRARAAAEQAGISTEGWPNMPDENFLRTAVAVAGANKDLAEHFDRDRPTPMTEYQRVQAEEIRARTAATKAKTESKANFLKSIGREQPAAPVAELKGGSATGAEGGVDAVIDDDGNLVDAAGNDIIIGQEASDAVNDLVKPGKKAPPTVRQIFDALPPEAQTGILYNDDPQQAFSKYLLQRNGIEIESDGKGGFRMRIGGAAGGGDLTRRVRGKIQEKQFDAGEGLARLADIKRLWKPKYQQVKTRFGAWLTGWKAKLNRDISPEDRRALSDFAASKQSAIKNINLYIKEITGAQMSEKEADRLRKGIPDPGEGIWDGDDPITFERKLDETISALRRANVRYQRALAGKVDWRSIPLNSIPDINTRGDELMKIHNNDRALVIQELRKEGYAQ